MSPQDDHGMPTPHGSPSLKVIVILVALDLLLMVFSVVMWQLGNDAMAATAGAGAIALTADIARRLLADVGARTTQLAPPPRLRRSAEAVPEDTPSASDDDLAA